MQKTTLTFIIILIISQTGITAQAHEVTSCGITEIIKSEQSTIPENYIAGNPINLEYSFTTLNNTPVQIITNISQAEINKDEWKILITIDKTNIDSYETMPGNFSSDEIFLSAGIHNVIIKISSLPYIILANYVISSVLSSTPCISIEHIHETVLSSDSSGSSGGLGVISNEPLSNVACSNVSERDWRYNTQIIYNFNCGNVYEVSINPQENTFEVMFKLETLKANSLKTTALSNAYNYINMYSGVKRFNVSVIRFKLPLDWVSDKESITLMKWSSNTWESLPTIEISSDSSYKYYESTTDTFSSFAIIANTITAPATLTIVDTPIVTPIITATSLPNTAITEIANQVPANLALNSITATIIMLAIILLSTILLYLKRKPIKEYFKL